ncbi:MAG: hypothetical protein ACLTAF_02555 [Blautia coccoides]
MRNDAVCEVGAWKDLSGGSSVTECRRIGYLETAETETFTGTAGIPEPISMLDLLPETELYADRFVSGYHHYRYQRNSYQVTMVTNNGDPATGGISLRIGGR